MMTLTHKEQEQEGDSKFTGTFVHTKGFGCTFGKLATGIMLLAINKIKARYGDKADYLQVFEYKGVKFQIIDDGHCVTALLPSEY